MFEMWKSIIVTVCLGYFSVEDIRKKELSSLSLALAGIVGIGLSIGEGAYQDWHVFLRLLPGLVCLGLGWLTRESVGYGDGLLILCLGCFLSLHQLLIVCFTALTLVGVAAIFLLLVLHRGKKTQIPFAPFLLAGYGISLLS